MNSNNIFNDINISEPSDDQRHKACVALWLEYRGSGTSLDEENIGLAAKSITRSRLSQFSLYINLVKPIIDKENSTYNNPPTRIFKTKNGKNVSKSLNDHIHEILDKFRYDTFMQRFEVDAALFGTVLVNPTYNSASKRYNLVELTPVEKTLKVIPDLFIKSIPDTIEYKPAEGTTVKYDTKNIVVITRNESGQEVSKTTAHKFDGNPFVVLNYFVDNGTFYGPFDGTLYSFVKQRSLILANSMSAMHLSEAERLVVSGMGWEEALGAIKDRMIVLPNDKIDKAGNQVQQKVDVLRPEYKEALALIENYLRMYHHLLDVRGHQMKQFSVGADAQSAEAVRLGGIDMSQQTQRKRGVLAYFEKELWKRIIWLNNSITGNMNIPEDTQIIIDWKPESLHFSSASDETLFFEKTMTKDVTTPVDWIRSRNPELSLEEALQKLQDNKKFNDEAGVHENQMNNGIDNDNSSNDPDVNEVEDNE